MANLVTFYAVNAVTGDVGMVGIGLTDEMIERLKEKTAVLEPADRTGIESAPDVLIVYGKDLNTLVANIKKVSGNKTMKTRIL